MPRGLAGHRLSPRARPTATVRPLSALAFDCRFASGISIWVYRHTSQSVCPWNLRFSKQLPNESPYLPRQVIGDTDARQLARELLGMTQEEFSHAFKGSPMKRAKLRGLKRSAAVVLGNVGTAEDVDVLTRALDDAEPLVREHAAWALDQLAARPAKR